MVMGANDAEAATGAAGGMPDRRTADEKPLGLAPALMLLLTLAAITLAVITAGRVARDRATANLNEQAAAALPLAAAALSSVIEKQRLIPTVLSRDPEVITQIAATDPAAEARLAGIEWLDLVELEPKDLAEAWPGGVCAHAARLPSTPAAPPRSSTPRTPWIATCARGR